MLFKELLKIMSEYNIKIYINGYYQDTKNDWSLYKYEEYEVRRVGPSCEATCQQTISKTVQIEPFLNVYLNAKKEEVYEVETGRLDENNIEFGFKFVEFKTYEEAKGYYDRYEINDQQHNYKTLFKVTLYNNEELYRDVVEEIKKTRS
jgi:hypothetical protein